MTQLSFSTLWSGFATAAEAKAARDAAYKSLKSRGYQARRSVLKNQLKKYESFGVPDGRSCDCYYIDGDFPWELARSLQASFGTPEQGR